MTSKKTLAETITDSIKSYSYRDITLPDHKLVGEETQVKEFAKNETTLRGDELKEIIDHLRRLAQSEQEREKQIEAKALSLIGFTGLVSTLIIGFYQFGRDNNPMEMWLRIGIGGLYVSIAISLFLTVLGAIRTVKVGKYPFMFPLEGDLFKLTRHNKNKVFLEYARDLTKSYAFNVKLINVKATYVSVAQNWFQAALTLSVILLTLIGYQIITSPQTPAPQTVIMVTTTPVLMTPIPSPSSTATIVSITATLGPVSSITPLPIASP